MIVFRQTDPRFPLLWEDVSQPEGRWHGPGEGPVHYFADTPDGAWAELLRHEEITDPLDVLTIRRAMWAVEIPDGPYAEPDLPTRTLTGGPATYPRCQAEAGRLRASDVSAIEAPSAAVLPGRTGGMRVEGGLQDGPPRDSRVFVLFGPRPTVVGWRAAAEGRPAPELLRSVRPFPQRRRR